MNESTNPLPLPEQTLLQVGPNPSKQALPPLPPAPATNPAESTGTLAAPENYDPNGVAASTRAYSSSDSKPSIRTNASYVAGRYAVLRALAKGGMGQVSVARDIELDREIALKEIQPKFGMDSATLHRFMLEARVTGKLEHPGIVPVYGLGSYEDGRPYYAMRFITGHSFQEAIDEFHKKEGPDRDPQERSLALRQMLRRFVDVCNTIGYAHSRGILHRDIKPANVMIGAYGETLVVDWGLAKEMLAGTPSQIPVVALSDAEQTALHKPFDPNAYQETQEGFTLYGQTMGTPAFMSPEQAAGKWDVTGVASDVYSLGAMLYSILSGEPPYSGPSMEVITRVQRGEHKPVKMVKGDTPSPLDAICRKAMAFDIKDRYPSALALANDVERWVADEPVSCYREPFLKRASRWARRHRTAVAAASVLLVTATVALAIGLYLVNRERREKEKAFHLASESRSETREALLDLTDDALGDILASSSKVTPEQVKFLNSISDKYRHFAEKEPDGPETKLFIAGAWYRIGRIDARLARYPSANESYAKAFKMLDDPSIAGTIDGLKARGDVQLYEGIVALQTNKPEAESLFLDAMKTFNELLAKDPKPDYRNRLAQCQDRLGVFYLYYAKPPRFGDAERSFKESLAIREQLAKEFPKEEEYQFRVAQSYRMLTDIDFKTGKIAEGRGYSERALATLNKLVTDHPTSVVYLRLLADMETLLAEHYSVINPNTKFNPKMPAFETPALIHSRGAVLTWAKLVALNPGDISLRQHLAEANVSLAKQGQYHNRPREAITALSTAATLLKEINRDQPNDSMTEMKLAQTLLGLTSIYREIIDKNAASAADEAVAAAEAIAKKLPASAEAHTYAALAHVERSIIRLGKAGVKGTVANPAGARDDLDAAWPHVESSGNTEAALKYGRGMVDWMIDVEDFKEAGVTGAYLAALKLPRGMAYYVAACFHGRVAKLILEDSDATAEQVKVANQNIALSLHYLREAVKAGFDNANLLETDSDLYRDRLMVEFKPIIDSIKSKSAPKGKDN